MSKYSLATECYSRRQRRHDIPPAGWMFESSLLVPGALYRETQSGH
jgi:hypothetical protein